MTHDGALLGTPNYMSPEQVRGESLDGRADLFALGSRLLRDADGHQAFRRRLDLVGPLPHRQRASEGRLGALRSHGRSARDVLWRRRSRRTRAPGSKTARPSPPRSGEPRRTAATVSGTPRRDDPSTRAVRRRSGQEPAVRRSRSRLPGCSVASSSLLAGAAAIVFSGRVLASARRHALRARAHGARGASRSLQRRAARKGTSVSFAAEAPFGVLSAAQGCREAKHRLEPADAGREIVLVLDPRAPRSRSIRGSPERDSPSTARRREPRLRRSISICAATTRSRSGPRAIRTAVATIPAKATPLDARTAAASAPAWRRYRPAGSSSPRAMPRRVRLRRRAARPADASSGIELPEGPHEIRITNDERFVDVTRNGGRARRRHGDAAARRSEARRAHGPDVSAELPRRR